MLYETIEAIKQSVIKFYKWYEKVWPNKNVKVQENYISSMIITQTKRVGSIEKNYCPCSIDWKFFNRYCLWVKGMEAPVSDLFFYNWRANLLESEKSLSQSKEEREEDDGGKDLWFYKSCFFENAQDSPQDYAAMGFYDNRCL